MKELGLDTSKDDVYRELQQHLDKTPMGFPPAESGADIRLLKFLFTPKEALIATHLTYSTYPVDSIEEIHERMKDTDITRQELEDALDRMASKGVLHFRYEGEKKYYNNANWVVGMYEFQVNKLTKEFLEAASEYNGEAFNRPFLSTRPTQLRVIPVQKSFTPESPVSRYDDIRKLIDTADQPFAVVNCICRQSHDIRGEPCKATERQESCLCFGHFAEMYIDKGWGREITKEELIQILDANQRDGLVLQPSNSEKLEFVCSCCGCCCGLLRGKGAMHRPIDFFTTNFYSSVDTDLCSSCGTCVDLCQMKALSLDDSGLVINLDRCIGCGICVANCPEGALTLLKRESQAIPPISMEDTYTRIADRRRQA